MNHRFIPIFIVAICVMLLLSFTNIVKGGVDWAFIPGRDYDPETGQILLPIPGGMALMAPGYFENDTANLNANVSGNYAYISNRYGAQGYGYMGSSNVAPSYTYPAPYPYSSASNFSSSISGSYAYVIQSSGSMSQYGAPSGSNYSMMGLYGGVSGMMSLYGSSSSMYGMYGGASGMMGRGYGYPYGGTSMIGSISFMGERFEIEVKPPPPPPPKYPLF